MNPASVKRILAKPLARMDPVLAPVLRRPWMWAEAVVITLGAVALGWLLQRGNPLEIGAQFPWIWLAPVLVALRYGVLPGIFSSLVLVATWYLLTHAGVKRDRFPQEYFFGGLMLVMLAGEFSAVWFTRLRRAEETNRYLAERLSRLTLRHVLLKQSHDRMEQEMLTKPVTLRDALTELRKLASAGNHSSGIASRSLLQLLTHYCQLESAAIFEASATSRTYTRICDIGSPPGLLDGDPLLSHALRHEQLSHILTEGLSDAAPASPFLVIAPILASNGHRLGILAVDRLPFLALNADNLQMLAVMLGYYADCVAESDAMRVLSGRLADAPADFAAEFSRALRLQRDFRIDSHVALLSFPSDKSGRHAVSQHELTGRSIDISWRQERGRRTVLANLMPLASEAAAREYLLRIGTRMAEYEPAGDQPGGLRTAVIGLGERDPAGSLMRATRDIST